MPDTGDMTHTILTIVFALVPPPAGYNVEPILEAIAHVETGGEADPSAATGDGGASIGPLQIQRGAWLDAVEHDPSLTANGETYANCRNLAYAKRVAIAYWSRYAPDWKPATLAGIWNGGPKGHRKASTAHYRAKVEARLREMGQ